MTLRFLFAALLLHVTYVGSNRCPTRAQMGPCRCTDWSWGLTVFCSGRLVDEIRDALANVANTKQSISSMTLKDVWLPNLPPTFLLGHDVNALRLENCNISSVDKDAFVAMAATLHQLLLLHNALERVPSQALEKCLSLTELNLSYNRIDILHAKAFLGLDSLQQLSLMGNRIKFIDNSAFVGIGKRFEYLDLDGNELTAVPCLPLRYLTSLKRLDLRNNRIASLLPEELDAMRGESLEYFNLSNNAIRHLPARVFRLMKRLVSLYLSGNAIESIHPTALEGTEGFLEYLSLGYNRLEEVPSAALKNMSVLEIVDLDGNKICKIRKHEFLTYGKSLDIIYLRNNSLEYLDPNAFTGLNSLTELWLGSNQLTGFPYETFAPVLPMLQWFDIHDNPLHCDCNLSWIERPEWIQFLGYNTKCATPEKYANDSLLDIDLDQLVCNDNTSNPTEPCCNCFSNTRQQVFSNSQKRVSSNVLMSILQICLMYFWTTILIK